MEVQGLRSWTASTGTALLSDQPRKLQQDIWVQGDHDFRPAVTARGRSPSLYPGPI